MKIFYTLTFLLLCSYFSNAQLFINDYEPDIYINTSDEEFYYFDIDGDGEDDAAIYITYDECPDVEYLEGCINTYLKFVNPDFEVSGFLTDYIPESVEDYQVEVPSFNAVLPVNFGDTITNTLDWSSDTVITIYKYFVAPDWVAYSVPPFYYNYDSVIEGPVIYIPIRKFTPEGYQYGWIHLYASEEIYELKVLETALDSTINTNVIAMGHPFIDFMESVSLGQTFYTGVPSDIHVSMSIDDSYNKEITNYYAVLVDKNDTTSFIASDIRTLDSTQYSKIYFPDYTDYYYLTFHFPDTIKKLDGETIFLGDSIKAFVVAEAINAYDTSYSIKWSDYSIQLRKKINTCENLVLIDSLNNYKTSDLYFSFDQPIDEEGIAYYLLTIAKVGTSVYFPTTIISNRHMIFDTTGNHFEFFLPDSFLTNAGDSIYSGTNYYVKIFSVPDTSYYLATNVFSNSITFNNYLHPVEITAIKDVANYGTAKDIEITVNIPPQQDIEEYRAYLIKEGEEYFSLDYLAGLSDAHYQLLDTTSGTFDYRLTDIETDIHHHAISTETTYYAVISGIPLTNFIKTISLPSELVTLKGYLTQPRNVEVEVHGASADDIIVNFNSPLAISQVDSFRLYIYKASDSLEINESLLQSIIGNYYSIPALLAPSFEIIPPSNFTTVSSNLLQTDIEYQAIVASISSSNNPYFFASLPSNIFMLDNSTEINKPISETQVFYANHTFWFSNPVSNTSIQIFNVDGNAIAFFEIENGADHFTFNNQLSSGVYFYRILGEKIQSTGKFIEF